LGLGHITIGVGGLSTAITAIAISGRIGVVLVASLTGAVLLLIVILAITGTFGSQRCRGDAQTVLAILLGRRRDPGIGQTTRSPRQVTAADNDQAVKPNMANADPQTPWAP
jgi:hypothetical protein